MKNSRWLLKHFIFGISSQKTGKFTCKFLKYQQLKCQLVAFKFSFNYHNGQAAYEIDKINKKYTFSIPHIDLESDNIFSAEYIFRMLIKRKNKMK